MVSVIIPNYNHALYLEKRIDSVLNQTYRDFELILLDDCSTDNSKDIIERYKNDPKVSQVIYNDINTGSTFKQWNKGIELAKGEYIWIAESDDYAEPNLLEMLTERLISDNKLSFSYCQSHKVNQNDVITGDWSEYTNCLDANFFKKDFTLNGEEFIKNFLIDRNVVPNASAVVFRKDNYMQIGGVDQNIKYCADWFLWLKMLTIGDVAFSPLKMNYFRYHEKSTIASASIVSKTVIDKKYDIIMRFALQKYLEEIHKTEICKLNKSYISKEALIESHLNISANNYMQALKYLYWGMLYSYDRKEVLKKGFNRIFNK